MEYGILVVEGEEGQYQILGAVSSVAEAIEMVKGYERCMGPDNPEACLPPFEYVINRRGPGGYYTKREVITTGVKATRQINEALDSWVKSFNG